MEEVRGRSRHHWLLVLRFNEFYCPTTLGPYPLDVHTKMMHRDLICCGLWVVGKGQYDFLILRSG